MGKLDGAEWSWMEVDDELEKLQVDVLFFESLLLSLFNRVAMMS